MRYNRLSFTYRGVAQLVARAVWDREVEGSSPFTPTMKKRLSLDSLFFMAELGGLGSSTFCETKIVEGSAEREHAQKFTSSMLEWRSEVMSFLARPVP